MIQVVRVGIYEVVYAADQTRVLVLDGRDCFTFTNELRNNSKIVRVEKPEGRSISVRGHYRMYEVREEPYFANAYHLELNTGNGLWSSYLLPFGLPTDTQKSCSVYETSETISKSDRGK